MKKKLLLLGGTSISRQIVYAAHEMGLLVYVTDYNEDSPCKKIADKSFMVSCTDIDAVVQLIKEYDIDGVIMGYADILMPSYVKICEKAGLPCYANLHAIEVTSNKSKFKSCCREHGIPVVPEYSFDDVEKGNVIYPLIVKPVDNSGARGIYICHGKEEFDKYYPKALASSPSKHILIERYMECKEATAFYYMHKSEIYLLGVADRHMFKFSDNFLRLPIGYTFPSINKNEFLKDEDGKIKSLFHSLGMNEGMAFIQCFNDDGKYIVYEMGYRLTGSIEQHLMEHAYGFNHLKAMIKYAVGDNIDLTPLRSEKLGNAIMANVTLLLSEGVINNYEGESDVMKIPGVLHLHKSYEPGTVVDDSMIGKLAQVGIRVLLYADNHDQLINRMDEVKDMLKVMSTEQKDMILRGYSYKEKCII